MSCSLSPEIITLDPLVAGDSGQYKVTLRNKTTKLPVDITDWIFTLNIKASHSDTELLYTDTIDPTINPLEGTAEFIVPEEETTTWPIRKLFVQMYYIDNNGFQKTVLDAIQPMKRKVTV